MLGPVNRLPREVISHIAWCRRDEDAIDGRPIIPLTHVCRYWRESIISTPKHWTAISSHSKNLMTLSLERSKAAPLHLRLEMGHVTPEPGFRDLITPYTRNVESLRFKDLTSIEDVTQTLPGFPLSTPNLRSLELTRKTRKQGSIPSLGLFSNTLRSLSLSNIPLYRSFRKLRSLTELYLYFDWVHTPLDNLLEANRSLESVHIVLDDEELTAKISRPRIVVLNQLQRLSIECWERAATRILVSSIPLRRGAHLEITFLDFDDADLALNDIIAGIPMTHFPNLSSPTFMEYRSSPLVIRLTGTNGSFKYHSYTIPSDPFEELPILPLSDVKNFHLVCDDCPLKVPHPSSFPSLEALTFGHDTETDISSLFSAMFPNPSFFPSLKTLGFLDCVMTEAFMEELTAFAASRKDTTSARLYRVVIIKQNGALPSAASIKRMEEHVPVVDVRFGRTLPTDLV